MTDQEPQRDEAPEAATKLAELAGKYITFRVANEEYGVDILKVQELLRLTTITRVPKSSAFIRGVINLRGRVIPVADLRIKFELDRTEDTELSGIIVVHCTPNGSPLVMGLFVDEVLEALHITGQQLEAKPDFGGCSPELDFVTAVAQIDERVIFLLDLDRVLSSAETRELAKAGAQAA